MIAVFGVLAVFGDLAMGCGKGGTNLDSRIDALTTIKAEVCACKDKACADTAHDKYVALKNQNSKDDRPTDDQMKRYEDARQQLQACWHELNGTADTGSSMK